MADKHPYTSGPGGLTQAVGHLRKSFPAQVTAETLKKLGIAPNNESYVLNILRFVGVLDADGKKNGQAAVVFNKHGDDEFQEAFAELVEKAYSDLFGLHGSSAWSLTTDKLISYFRNTDHTSALVGQRQASTFQVLAGLAGKGGAVVKTSAPKAKRADAAQASVAKAKPSPKAAPSPSPAPPAAAPVQAQPVVAQGAPATSGGMALTVRLEINLPAGGDQQTYDRIFRSIRENLLNGKAT